MAVLRRRQSGSAGPPLITAEGFLEVLIFPVRGFVIWEKNGQIKDVDVTSPLIGEVFGLKQYPQIRWWERVRAELMHLIRSASS